VVQCGEQDAWAQAAVGPSTGRRGKATITARLPGRRRQGDTGATGMETTTAVVAGRERIDAARKARQAAE